MNFFSNFRLAGTFIILVLPFSAHPKAQPKAYESTIKKVEIKSLYSTEPTYDLTNVLFRARKLINMPTSELSEYIKEHPAEAIEGPDNQIYLIDPELALALDKIGVRSMYVEIQKDYSDYSPMQFKYFLAARYNLLKPGPIYGMPDSASLTPLKKLSKGELIMIDLSDPHPTQFEFGALEVETKLRRFLNKSRQLQIEYLLTHPLIVVRGPGGTYYVIDHHHLLIALKKLGFKRGIAKVWADFSDLSEKEFHQRMLEEEWYYLYRNTSTDPLHPNELPEDASKMRDNPYRSLAYFFLRAHPELEKQEDEVYLENALARAFKEHGIRVGEGSRGIRNALKEANKIAKDDPDFFDNVRIKRRDLLETQCELSLAKVRTE